MTRKHVPLPADYFVPTNPLVTVFILFGLFYLLPVSLLNPGLVPDLGPTTVQYKLFVEQYNVYIWFTFLISVYIHVVETLIALALCNRHQLTFSTTLKWAGSVLINGVFSLRYLVSPAAKEKKMK